MTTPAGGDGESEPFVKNWQRFFHKFSTARIREAADAAGIAPHLAKPWQRSLQVSFHDVERHGPDLAEALAARPVEVLAAAEEALRLVEPARLHVRVLAQHEHGEAGWRPTQKPAELLERDLARLGNEDLGRLVSVRCLVKRVSVAKPEIVDAVFRCKRCGVSIREPQTEHLVLKEPLECYEEQGGCGRDTEFNIILGPAKGSELDVSQPVLLEQLPEDVPDGTNPASLEAWLRDDAAHALKLGDRVRVTGILQCAVRKDRGVKQRILDTFLDISSVEPEKPEEAGLEWTKEDGDVLEELQATGDLIGALLPHLAPDVNGMEFLKLACLLSLAGGQPTPDDRHQGHVLVIGDPSTAKTKALRRLAQLAPRRVIAPGARVTVPGLTMASVKDPTGKTAAAAGSLIRATSGVLFIPEAHATAEGVLEKALNEPMEHQVVEVEVADVKVRVPIDTTIWLDMNPVDGTLDDFVEDIEAHTNLTAATFSRFDFIVVVKDDTRDEARSRRIIEHMVKRRYAPRAMEGATPPRVSDAFLRRFIARAHAIEVEAGEDVQHLIAEKSFSLRHPAVDFKQETPKNVRFRQIAAMFRIAEEFCKLLSVPARGSIERASVTSQHVDLAHATLLKSFAMIRGKDNDADTINIGQSAVRRELQRELVKTIRTLGAGRDGGVPIEEVLANFPKGEHDRVRYIMSSMRERDQLLCSHDDRWRVGRTS